MGKNTNRAILFVDDEQSLGNLCQRVLSKHGYTIFVALNGEEAVTIYREKLQQIGLILLDMVLPVMTGRECLQQIFKINPHAKVIVTSGYGFGGESTSELIHLGVQGFLNKPFEIKQLVEIVQTHLKH